ncbi:MAG TPA: cell division protein ZapA [Termitinemataceae bacterium]|nr:cell division protein ZapA [Termitinemataceae bacterium]HOM22639.1 cell division protein ZapA [Termitinemataceae bacterium]HPP99478.1 cell division protein ZapA [Termitinemataceae bacterium]
MSKERFRIDMLGTSFVISVDEDPLYLNALLTRYQAVLDSVEKNTGVTDPLKQSIIAGLLLCDELEKAQRKLNQHINKESTELKKAASIVTDLIERIEATLGKT